MSSDSNYREARVTLTADGEERDYFVRGFVEIEPSASRGWSASLDGDPDVMIDGTWCPVDSVALDDGDEERIEEALCTAALEDDSDLEEWDDR